MGSIDIDDIEWKYLEGDGDFQSSEITNLRNEADIIITNPPFSLFKEFPQAIENTRRIADSIDMSLPMGQYHLPNFPIPTDSPTQDPDEYLKMLTQTGAEAIYGEISPEIKKRINHIVGYVYFCNIFHITSLYAPFCPNQGPICPQDAPRCAKTFQDARRRSPTFHRKGAGRLLRGSW